MTDGTNPPPPPDPQPQPQPAAPRRLYRSRDDRMIAGVCGGIARHFNMDPTVVRLIAAATILLPGPSIIAYVIAWIVVPEEPVAT